MTHLIADTRVTPLLGEAFDTRVPDVDTLVLEVRVHLVLDDGVGRVLQGAGRVSDVLVCGETFYFIKNYILQLFSIRHTFFFICQITTVHYGKNSILKLRILEKKMIGDHSETSTFPSLYLPCRVQT